MWVEVGDRPQAASLYGQSPEGHLVPSTGKAFDRTGIRANRNALGKT